MASNKLTPDPEKLAALERYLNASGHGADQKVQRIKAPARGKAQPVPRRKKLTALEYRDAIIDLYKLEHLEKSDQVPAYDVTRATRYPAAPLTAALGNERLASTMKRHAWVMNPQGVTAGAFRAWRENIMCMTAEQLAVLVRVSDRTVRNWENGTSEIPFSMWWMMTSTLQDPEFFLTRPGFHDFYIDYDRERGEPLLRSYTWPDIRYSPSDLYVNRTALNQVTRLETKVDQQEKTIGELTAENTRLRQMLKAGTVAAELSAMHEHIGQLLKQMHTADIVAFPESPAVVADILEFPRQAHA